MKKLYSLIKACMTNDMSLFKINTKKNNKKAIILPLFICLYLMFMIWGSANSMFEKISSTHIEWRFYTQKADNEKVEVFASFYLSFYNANI